MQKPLNDEVQLVDDADWVLFGEIAAKLIQLQQRSSDDEDGGTTRTVQDTTMVVSGADIKYSVANFREGKIGMTVASCKPISKFAIGFAKDKTERIMQPSWRWPRQ